LASIPVILVTSLSNKEDQERGMEVGANAYILKHSFDKSNLLSVVEQII
jgi:two-component system chemotaxis sensor kinase CheA